MEAEETGKVVDTVQAGVKIGASCATHHSGEFTTSGQLNPPLYFLFSPLSLCFLLCVFGYIFSCGP